MRRAVQLGQNPLFLQENGTMLILGTDDNKSERSQIQESHT